MGAPVADNREALQERKTTLLAEADESLAALLGAFVIPVTRPQWAQWLDDNYDQFRELMRTAPALRRQGNVRVRARPGLPAPARRIQPQAERSKPEADWAKRLANRTGWWGLKTRDNGSIIIFLLLLRGRTYYMDMGNRAATGVPNCIVGISFLLRSDVGELPRLEELLADDEVLQVLEFKALVLAMSLFYLTMVSYVCVLKHANTIL